VKGELLIRFRRCSAVGVVAPPWRHQCDVSDAQSESEKPKATEIGGHGDGDPHRGRRRRGNPFAPGVFQGAVDGVKGGAA